MALREELETQGNWLFRYRTFLPLVLLIPLAFAMISKDYRFGNQHLHAAMQVLSLLMAVTGVAIRFLVAGYVPDGTSGRNTKQQVAISLNTTGLYSVVRHPLYLGNFLLWGSMALFCLSGWFVAVFCLIFWVYYERIMYAEEAFLRSRFGAAFDKWAARTPAFFPKLSSWNYSTRPFCWRRAVRQEYTTFFLVLEAQVAFQLFEVFAFGRRFTLSEPWLTMAAVILVAYLGVRYLKKNTNVLATSVV